MFYFSAAAQRQSPIDIIPQHVCCDTDVCKVSLCLSNLVLTVSLLNGFCNHKNFHISFFVCHLPLPIFFQADALNIYYKPGDCCDVIVNEGGFRVNVKRNCGTCEFTHP